MLTDAHLLAERRVVAPAEGSPNSNWNVIAGCHSRLDRLSDSLACGSAIEEGNKKANGAGSSKIYRSGPEEENDQKLQTARQSVWKYFCGKGYKVADLQPN